MDFALQIDFLVGFLEDLRNLIFDILSSSIDFLGSSESGDRVFEEARMWLKSVHNPTAMDFDIERNVSAFKCSESIDGTQQSVVG